MPASPNSQWRRSVAKHVGVRVSQVKPSNTNCFRLHPTSMISPQTQQSRFLTACRGASTNWFYLPFMTRVFHPWWCETCRVIQQQFWMKECDILGGRIILWPLLHIFSGQDPTPTPKILRPYQCLILVGTDPLSSRWNRTIVQRSPAIYGSYNALSPVMGKVNRKMLSAFSQTKNFQLAWKIN